MAAEVWIVYSCFKSRVVVQDHSFALKTKHVAVFVSQLKVTKITKITRGLE